MLAATSPRSDSGNRSNRSQTAIDGRDRGRCSDSDCPFRGSSIAIAPRLASYDDAPHTLFWASSVTFDPYPQASAPHQTSLQGRDRPAQDGRRQLDVNRLPDHRERLFRAAYALCGSREQAEDLVQETFVRVLRKPRFLHREDDLAYLLKVLRNTWINAYKERLRRPQTVEFDESTDFVVDHSADPGVSIGEIQALYAAVHELSPLLRDTLVAVDILGLSYKQAAQALHVRQGTIMSRLHRARDGVAKRLEHNENPTARPGP